MEIDQELSDETFATVWVVRLTDFAVVDWIYFGPATHDAVIRIIGRPPSAEWNEQGVSGASWLVSQTEILDILEPYFGGEFLTENEMKYLGEAFALSLIVGPHGC